ncbi:hypothetical protein F9L33_05640 [Amylibacter sp. SFDW26]|uniref:hypothetical protein n=1 Tax=Amylibacter sp. SFDW26 TaxID=2652722 RepID=UPI00126256B3|nr:hypothetical protein [Amylibacter sp. SFDW26]KAB7616231.1 hypothetical protein F9L33_05640 [Amylibacter sp. SFDW26]
MRAYWLLGCLFLASCGVPTQVVHKGGQFVEVGSNSFAIFTEAEHVTVIQLGQGMIANAKDFARMALVAISHTTKCGVKQGSLQMDGKSVQAKLKCIRPNKARLRGPSVSIRIRFADFDPSEGDISELGHP